MPTKDSGMDIGVIDYILEKNKDKNFVQRILNPDTSPRLDLGNGSFATHKMSWTEVDGKYIVYPKVVQGSDGNLLELSSDDAFNHAVGTGEYIDFQNASDAEAFSKDYKKMWKK
jgi:hypothetical protein